MIVYIPTIEIKKHWSPFVSSSRPWSLNARISVQDVCRAVSNNQLIGCNRQEHCGIDTRELHIRRIAWFVVNGITLPISIFVGPEKWIISDGNHRFAAAIVRRDENIKVNFRGDLEKANDLFTA